MGPDFLCQFWRGETTLSNISMNKLLVIAVLVAALALSGESFRVARQAEDGGIVDAVMSEPAPDMSEGFPEVPEVSEPVPEVSEPVVSEPVPEVSEPEPAAQVSEGAKGPVTRVTEGIQHYYAQGVDTVNGYIESIKGLKLEEKAKNLYDESVKAGNTYYGIIYDQVYHAMYPQQ